MKPFEKSRWIWCNEAAQADEYGEFVCTFQSPENGASLFLSCDGDYALWINGTFASSNQYGDFEHYKIYDEIDLTPYLNPTENRLAILVWHFGSDSQRYKKSPAGLIFEVRSENEIIAVSGTETLARKSLAYQNGRKKKITGQLGYGFGYDATKEDLWITSGDTSGFSPAIPVEKNCDFYPLPIEKLQLKSPVYGNLIRAEETRMLYDLGGECVGLLSFALTCGEEQPLRISFGEHLNEEGWVPRRIGGRDFSVEYVAKAGENEYFNPMLRFGCRYLEIESSKPLEEVSIGLIPQIYPKTRVKAEFATELDRKIYEICMNSLDLCMMEHYVDCPWREQNLYAFDSRNQMLCGYQVYENKNAAYARANLKLFSQDRRQDNLLSICSPCGSNLTIPSFSLYYMVSVNEYVKATQDRSLGIEVYPKMKELLDTFVQNRTDGLAARFSGVEHWNFYDWSDYCEGTLLRDEAPEPDAAINCILILALEAFHSTCEICELEYPYGDLTNQLREKTYRTFFVRERGLITMRTEKEEFSDLCNALAVLTEVVNGDEAKGICDRILAGETTPCSLSMRIFKYEALLKTNSEKYYPEILKEIRRDYGSMIDRGADCAWETLEGATAFENAGSLCHGWSAVPVLFLPQIQK